MPNHAEPIGDAFDCVGFVQSGVHITFDDAEAITFLVYADAGDQAVTLKESQDGSNEANLAVIDTIWEKVGAGGTWAKITQTAAATYDHSTDATNDLIAFTVYANQLSDGFNAVEVTTTGTSALTTAFKSGLKVKRDPANLGSGLA